MKEKKVHEVGILGRFIQEEAGQRGITRVVDFGSGQGYLSQVLAYGMGLKVVAIDNNELQTQGSQHRQQKISKNLERKDRTVSILSPPLDPLTLTLFLPLRRLCDRPGEREPPPYDVSCFTRDLF